MNPINFKRRVEGGNDDVINLVTDALKKQGFGVLTRIDLHLKIKEKLGVEIPPVVILGACNPQLAYEAFQRDPDVASLLPCNAVIRELWPGIQSVELARPSELLRLLGGDFDEMTKEAERKLRDALDQVSGRKAA